MSNESKPMSKEEQIRKFLREERIIRSEIQDEYAKVIHGYLDWESKQSSPIGVEQAAAIEFAEYLRVHCDSVWDDNVDDYVWETDTPGMTGTFTTEELYKKIFWKAGSQWASPRWVKASERLPEYESSRTYISRWVSAPRQVEQLTHDQLKNYARHGIEWLDETPAHPTAVNGDEELGKLIVRLAELKKYHMMPYNLGDMGEMGKIIDKLQKQFSQPKAAAPKADVKSKEELIEPYLFPFEDNQPNSLKVISKGRCLQIMEEYANQFKSQPQEKTFTLNDMIECWRAGFDYYHSVYTLIDGKEVNQLKYFKEKHGIDLNTVTIPANDSNTVINTKP